VFVVISAAVYPNDGSCANLNAPHCAIGKTEGIDERAFIEAARCNGRIWSDATVLGDPEIEEVAINKADHGSARISR
jgi:hypothetical protein